jgi:hypothetical protein
MASPSIFRRQSSPSSSSSNTEDEDDEHDENENKILVATTNLFLRQAEPLRPGPRRIFDLQFTPSRANLPECTVAPFLPAGIVAPQGRVALALGSRTVIVGLRFDQPYWYHSKILVPTSYPPRQIASRGGISSTAKSRMPGQLVEDKEEPK